MLLGREDPPLLHLPGLPSFADMGLEVLVGGLWGAVLAYWLWTRRPASDTVGAFHRELQVLQRATPARVAPANRLAPPHLPEEHLAPTIERFAATRPGPSQVAGAALPPQVAAAAAINKRSELRRRRRDVLTLLAVVAVITLFAAVLSGSTVAIAFQVSSDLALAVYMYLLSWAGRARGATAYVPRSRLYRPPAPPMGYELHAPARRQVRARARTRAPAGASASLYGDFDSYASLA